MADFVMPRANPAGKTDGARDSEITRTGAVSVRRGPIGDIAAGAGLVAVSNFGDDSVALLDAETLATKALAAVPGEPFAVAASDDRVFVSTSSSTYDAVSVIDPNTQAVIATYSMAYSITSLAVSPDGKRVYAGRAGDGHADVVVIDITADRVGTIDIAALPGAGVDAVAVDPSGKRLYVATTDAHGSALVIVDAETTRVVHVVRIGSPIRDVAFGDGTAYILTSDRQRGGVIAAVNLATNTVTDTVELGIGAPIQMVLTPNKTRAYVVDYDHVAVVCTLTHRVVDTVSVGVRPASVALDSHGRRLHIADYTGQITTFAVDSSMPLLYSQFMATDPIAARELRELEPVTA
jgi:DNA-binding beta-propeller fold protein YncE